MSDKKDSGTLNQSEKTTSSKKKFTLPKSKFITKREIFIILGVAVVIFLIVCSKPYSGEYFSCFKPSFWSVKESGGSYIFTIPTAGGDPNSVLEDKVIVTDITSELENYPTPKDYILFRINEEIDYASRDVADYQTEPVDIIEVGNLNTRMGQEAYYFIFTPGGEYSGNKIIEVAIKNGDKMVLASFRSRWMKFDNNYKSALKMIKTIKPKN